MKIARLFGGWRFFPGGARPNRFRAAAKKPHQLVLPRLTQLEDRTVPSILTVMNTLDSGAGSLRVAVASANNGDTVVFANNLRGQTIKLTTGEIDLETDITIQGLGADKLTISGSNLSEIFLNDGSTVTLERLTLTHGRDTLGGAIYNAGGASLTIKNCVLTDNEATGDVDALGGAVYNEFGSTLNVANTVFSNNTTDGSEQSFGGAIYNGGDAVITGSKFTGNQATGATTDYFSSTGGSLGGAIDNDDGSTLTVSKTTFTDNKALGATTGDGLGGAICNETGFDFPPSGDNVGVTTTVTDCTFRNNLAKGGSTATDGGFGGAIEDLPDTTLMVSNSTFTDNQCNGDGGVVTSGGAIDNSPGVTVTIQRSKFIDNAAIGGSTGADAYGGAVDNFDTMTITDTTFIGNKALGGSHADGVTDTGEGFGAAVMNEPVPAGAANGNLTVTNCTFKDNEAVGGSFADTTVVVQAGSGFGGGISNIGSPLTVTNSTFDGNKAIGGANAVGKASPGLGGAIDNESVSDSSMNVFTATLTASKLTVEDNIARGGTGASGMAGGDGVGGGISNRRSSTLTITNSVVKDNQAEGGTGGAGANGGDGLAGGVANGSWDFLFGLADTSSLTMTGGTISGNEAEGGLAGSKGSTGGDGLGGGAFFSGTGTATLDGTLVTKNSAIGGGTSQGNDDKGDDEQGNGKGDDQGNGKGDDDHEHGDNGKGGGNGNHSTQGQGIGGGVYITSDADVVLTLSTTVRNNHASTSHNDVFGTFKTS
jgi:hypothetical protein